MSLARLASELALPKSSVHGLCNTLMSFGYLRRQPDGAFLIGPRVMSLAEAFVSGTDVAQEFNALWVDAGAAPEETVVLSVLSGGDALYVAVRNSARPLGPGVQRRHAAAGLSVGQRQGDARVPRARRGAPAVRGRPARRT